MVKKYIALLLSAAVLCSVLAVCGEVKRKEPVEM